MEATLSEESMAGYLRLVGRDRTADLNTVVPEDDESGSSEEEEPATRAHQAHLASRRARRRAQRAMRPAETVREFGSVLEAQSVRSPATRASYLAAIEDFKKTFGKDLEGEADDSVDAGLVDYMKKRYMGGPQAWVGGA